MWEMNQNEISKSKKEKKKNVWKNRCAEQHVHSVWQARCMYDEPAIRIWHSSNEYNLTLHSVSHHFYSPQHSSRSSGASIFQYIRRRRRTKKIFVVDGIGCWVLCDMYDTLECLCMATVSVSVFVEVVCASGDQTNASVYVCQSSGHIWTRAGVRVWNVERKFLLWYTRLRKAQRQHPTKKSQLNFHKSTSMRATENRHEHN